MPAVFNLLLISMDRIVLELSVFSVIMGISCKRTAYKVLSESETNSILIVRVTVRKIKSVTYYYVNFFMQLLMYLQVLLLNQSFLKFISIVTQERN